jgi:hypothetical protein
VPVSVGGLARAVGAALVTAVAGTASVAGLDVGGGRGSDGDGSHEGADDGGDLHFEKCGVGFVGKMLVVFGCECEERLDDQKSWLSGGDILRYLYLFPGKDSTPESFSSSSLMLSCILPSSFSKDSLPCC